GVSVNAIGDFAMQNLKSLEYLTMPDTITEIGKYALANNYKLKRVHLSAGLTELKEGILQNCSSLDSVTIPKNVKRLDKSLFRNCRSLEEALFEDYDFKIKVIETDPMGSDNYYDSGQADISWYCFAGMSGRALHGLDFHETYTGTKYHRQLQAVELTDDWRQNIVKIHQSQKGYREGFSPYHLDGSNSKPFRLSNKAVDYEWGHFAEPSRFTGYQPATWCRAFIDWAYAMAGVYGYKSTEYSTWDATIYAGKGGTVELEPGDMLGMGKSHWCMVGSVKDQGDLLEIWIIHGNHGDRMVTDEVRHYDKKTGKATDMEDDDYDYFRAIYKIDFSGLEKQTVTLDAGEGKCDVKSRTYCKGAYYGAIPDAEREDYVFDGWYTEPGGKGKKAYPYRNLTDDVTTLYANYIYNPKAVKGVVLDRKSVKLQLGSNLKLNAAVKPADAENPSVSWRSGNDEVVSVKDGVIKGLKEGKATIMARTDAGPYVAYCEVEVTAEGGEGGTDDPEDQDEPSDDDDDGIRKGNLEDGKTIPEGIWIGGLKKKYTYTGKAVKPDFRVYYKDHRLVAGLDYTVSYKNNTNVGTAAGITVRFCNNFTGSKVLTFEIEKNPLTKGTVTADPQVTGYKKGKKNNNIRPQIFMSDGTQLKYTDRDFSLEYKDAKTGQESTCEETGDYIICMTAKDESTGYASGASVEVPLTVTDKPFMKGVKVTGKTKLAYTGEKLIPELTLKYAGKKLDSSYYTVDTVSGDDYRYPGSHTLVLKGDGVNVFGVRRITYTITGKRKLGDNKYTSVTLSAASLDEEGNVPYAYGGAKPEVVVTYRGNVLKKGRDYKVAYKNNKKAGKKAELTVKGIGKYSGNRKLSYTVSKRKISDLIIIVNDRAESSKAKDYEKTKIMFFSKDGFADQKLTKADYTVDFVTSSGSDTPKAEDTVTVTVSAGSAGNFKGEAKAAFRIIDGTKDIGKAKVSVHNGKPYAYTGKEIRPEGDDVTVKLQGAVIGAGSYDITYYNNVNHGNNAAIVLKGKNGFGGVKVVRFRIGSASYE
ncbi:MAG: leucine-rich repeat protein, partial [Lachnospiraceae bacterium]|nr:leucine-rich repeat protein [Lachnospiraceae bacterium]